MCSDYWLLVHRLASGLYLVMRSLRLSIAFSWVVLAIGHWFWRFLFAHFLCVMLFCHWNQQVRQILALRWQERLIDYFEPCRSF